MGPLSAYEVEQICESAYYHAVSRFNYHSDADFCALFTRQIDNEFTDYANPKLNNRAPENLRHISHKWRDKLRIEAERWYNENVERENDNDSDTDEDEDNDKNIGEMSDDDLYELKKTKPIAYYRYRRAECEEEIRKAKERVATLEENGEPHPVADYDRFVQLRNARSNVRRWTQKRDEYNEMIENAICREEEREKAAERKRKEEEEKARREAEAAERKRKEEEKRRREEEERRKKEAEAARLKADAEAKRKAQEEANRRQLAAMQAQWQAQQNPQPTPQAATPSVNGTATCPHCGNSVSKTSKFCTSCGTRLLVVCPNCGANVKATSKFCTACGTPMQQD